MSRNKSLFIFLILLAACSPAPREQKNKIALNADLIASHFGNEKHLILFPCVRCGCFIGTLNQLKEEDKGYLKAYTLITDTNCNKIDLPATHLPQRGFDSISQDIYNLTLVKKTNAGYQCRIIETEEGANLIKICREFFREH